MNRLAAALGRLPSLDGARARLAAVLLLAVFAAHALAAAALNSGACDELGAHIPSGVLYWQTGTYSGGIQNFPLGQLLVTLPAAFGVRPALWTEEHLLLFRLPVVVMGVLVCLLVWRLARSIYGEGVGLAALFFSALSVNLLAHGSLATLDLPATFFILLSIWLLLRVTESPGAGRMAVFALSAAAASLVKVQALVLYPYAIAVLALAWSRPGWFRGLAVGAGLNGDEARVLLPRAARGDPRGRIWDGPLSWLFLPVAWFALVSAVYLHAPGAGGSLLPPLYLEALAGLRAHSQGGHFAYFAGEYKPGGWWYFFPAAIALKTPLSMLGLVLVGAAGRWPARGTIFVAVPCVLLLGLAMASRINIGLRHVLPIYPFLGIAAAVGAARLWAWSGRARAWTRPLVVALLAAYAVHTAAIAPHYLSFCNLLAGGSRHGHRLLVDSNYDWGTNDRFLRRYIERSGQSYAIDPYAFRPANGKLLINVNALYGVLNGGDRAYAWLEAFEPVRQIAYTWFEYDIPPGTFPDVDDDDEAREQVVAHLDGLRAAGAVVDHPGYGTVLGRAYAEIGAYDLAFRELREVLRRHPGYAPALHLGGELTIRWKLGVLVFRGREYLDGFGTRSAGPAAAGDDERTVALARRGGMAGNLSRVEAELGLALLEAGDGEGAAARLRSSLRLDPKNPVATEMLRRLGVAP